jgi:hypothetical protein
MDVHGIMISCLATQIGLGLETALIAGSVELAPFAGCRLLITGGLAFLVA